MNHSPRLAELRMKWDKLISLHLLTTLEHTVAVMTPSGPRPHSMISQQFNGSCTVGIPLSCQADALLQGPAGGGRLRFLPTGFQSRSGVTMGYIDQS